MDENYCVYKHICPDGMVYVGMTKNKKYRFGKKGSSYKHQPFTDWIKYYGWDNIIHTIEFDNLYKYEAALYEDMLIEIYSSIGKSLNKLNSGRRFAFLLENKEMRDDCNLMMKIFRNKNKKYIKKRINTRQKDYRKKYYNNFRNTNEGKIYNRVAAFNQWMTNKGETEKIIETPAEARKKYIDFGYIPSYIKNDDIK